MLASPIPGSASSLPDHAPLVRAENLRKRYGDVEALRGINLEIHRGEVFGLLGPNGAGKTTTIEIIEGLRQPDSGWVTVCGLDPTRQSQALKERIGAQLQATVLPDKMRVEEALDLFASFYNRRVACSDLLKRFGLADKRKAYFDTLSGGQKQRLALALALVNDPELVLLDEPTSGLDAMVRRDIYSLIAQLRSERRTVLLTTHYIEEAERLCDRVAIVDRGRVVALGTPRELVQQSGQGVRLEVHVSSPLNLQEVKGLEAVLDCRERDGAYLIHTQAAAKAIVALVRHLEVSNNDLLDLRISHPTLEDVFVDLTGRRFEE
jgi:ABC-2 type transport system ATP-binding protein